MNVIIAGGRNFLNYEILKEFCDEVLVGFENINIVSGMAPGADTLGNRYAEEKGYPLLPFPAKWDDLEAPGAKIGITRYGKKFNRLAGFKRNEDMAKVGDMLIAFWDYKSGGTKNMIELAEEYKIRIKVKKY